MSGLSAEPPAKDAARSLDELLRPLASTDSPGLVVGVRYRAKTICRRGLGLASIEHGIANTPATRMRIGSTSKHFASFAALMLAGEGRLDLDAGVRTYLPELPVLEGEASLRQLMTMTGGYRCFIDLSFISHGMAVRQKGFAARLLAGQTEYNFPPGERWIYCNSGYQILSTVIERVSGTSLANFLRERIFEPNGMHDTALVRSDFEIHPGLATLHVPLAGGGYRRGIFPNEELGGEGGMVSTIDDMLGWLQQLRRQANAGGANAWSQMLAGARLSNGARTHYALGLMRTLHRGVETIHHAGGVVGGACQMLTVPAHDLDIVVLSNGASVRPTKLALDIVDAVLGDEVLAPAPAHARSDDFKCLVGRHYRAASGLVVGFSDLEGKLGMEVFGNEPIPMTLAPESLRLEYADAGPTPWEVRFTQRDAAAAPAVLEVAECGIAESMELADTASAADDPAGCFYCADLPSHARFVRNADRLHLQLQSDDGSHTLVLQAIADDFFTWKSLDDALDPLRGALVVDRMDGKVSGFRLNTARTRHLRFRLERDVVLPSAKGRS